MQHGGPVTRTLEPGITIFSAAEIRVVLLPVGEAAEEVFQRYASLIVRHRQVELNNVRSFYKEAQKSPFKFFPWKQGNMHFKFVPEDVALQPSPLAQLHNHRRILGVIGVMHCPNVEDVTKAYMQFEQRCKAFPDAFTVRCFAFEPSDDQIQEDRRSQHNFIMFPPGDWEQLDNHAEVVMHDFAACLLAELERWMLNASPAMVELAGLVDSPEFTGATALEAVQTRLYSDEELKTKKRYGRLQKAMGDYCLLAGSPLDAQDHYSTAVELGRTAQDWIFLAGALEGFSAAKVLNAAITHGAFAINQTSVFNDEDQWRSHGRKGGEGDCAGSEHDGGGSVSDVSRSSSAFGGPQFWAALRAVAGLEAEVRGLFSEAKASIRRRGGQPLLVENDLRLARFLAGLHGLLSRREVSEIVSGLQVAAENLALPEDRLLAFVEGAQVLGLVGSTRKRVLLLWQAVELSKFLGFPNTRTLEVARKALEPPDDPVDPDGGSGEAEPFAKGRPLSQSAVPQSWPQVRAGCLEAVLGLAIYAKQHADVWDAAAALLRDHAGDLSTHRMQSLLENLLAAASQMSPSDKSRPGPGPPPLLYMRAPRLPPQPQRPVRFTIALAQPKPSAGNSALGGRPGSGPFLYDPFSAKREKAAAKSQSAAAAGPVQWVCGEVAGVEVEVCNPAAVGMRIDKMVLEAAYVGDASMAPREYMTITSSTQAAWKPKPVSLNIPANTKPVRIVLEGTPLLKGMLVLTGCRLTAFGGVSWFQPWSKPPLSVAQQLAHSRRSVGGVCGASEAPSAGTAGAGSSDVTASPEARVVVVEPLPLVQLSLQPAAGPAGSQQDGLLDGLGMLPASTGTLGGAGDGAAATAAGATAAGAAAGAQAGGRVLRLLQGQVYAAQLTITNNSKVPVAWAGVDVRHKERGSRLGITVDSSALLAQLPLAAGQSASIPITFAAGVRHSHTAEEVLGAEVCLEYVGPDEAGPLLAGDDNSAGGSNDGGANGISANGSSGGAAAGGSKGQSVLGRHAVLPLSVHVQPSLQVSAVQFRQLYLPAAAAEGSQEGGSGSSSSTAGDGSPGSAGSSSVFERRCVMEVSVCNKGRWPLQVWMGPSLPDPAELAAPASTQQAQQEALQPPALPPGAEGLPTSGMLPPGRRCTVAYLLGATPTTTTGAGSSSGGAGAAGGASAAGVGVLGAASAHGTGPGRQPATFEEQSRQECAERLCREVALFYRVDTEELAAGGLAGAAIGTTPLAHGEVYTGLSYQSLTMLQPCALSVQLSAEPLQAGAGTSGGEEAAGAGAELQGGPQLQLVAAPEPDQQAHQQQHMQQQQQEPSPYRCYPAVTAGLGQLLSVTVTVTHHGSSSSSTAAAAAAAESGGGAEAAGSGGSSSSSSLPGLELELEAGLACCPVRGSEQEEGSTGGAAGGGGAGGAAAHDLTAVWAGQQWSSLRFSLGPGQSVQQRLGLCLLAPGVYELALHRWHCWPAGTGWQQREEQQQQQQRRKSGPPAPLVNTMVAVQPCYVLAAQDAAHHG